MYGSSNFFAIIVVAAFVGFIGLSSLGSETTYSTGDSATENCESLKNGDRGFIQLIRENEPGEPLVIYGKVLDKETGRSISKASFFLYQTDASGNYRSRFFGLPSFAKIRGKVTVNDFGCYKIKTILPGDYPGAKDNRHLHFRINARGYKKFENEFLFDGFLNEPMRKNAIETGTGTILSIKKDTQGTWVGRADLYLKKK